MTTESITSEGSEVSDPGTTMGVTVTPASLDEMDEADLDSMVQKASTPSLATLFQRGKDAGLLKPGKEYGGST